MPLRVAFNPAACFSQAGFQFLPLGEEVPLELSGDFSVGVGEAMFFFEGEFLPVERGEDGPTAFGSQIEGQEKRSRFRHKGYTY